MGYDPEYDCLFALVQAKIRSIYLSSQFRIRDSFADTVVVIERKAFHSLSGKSSEE